jgi:hypothetical protein
MKKTITMAVLFCGFIALLATAAFAAITVNGSKSNSFKVAGQAATASVNLSGPSDTQTVFTAPATGSFYLQGFCASNIAGGVQLDVSGIGPIAVTVPGRGLSCLGVFGTERGGDLFDQQCRASGELLLQHHGDFVGEVDSTTSARLIFTSRR